jgi:hypothetical protein
MTDSPLIGMTDKIPLFPVSFFLDHLLDPTFLMAVLPAEKCEISGPYANSVHVVFEDKVVQQGLPPKIIPFRMESEFLIETPERTVVEFYVLHNTAFTQFEGRIRVRQEGRDLKIGIYIYQLTPKDDLVELIAPMEITGLLRIKIRQLFQNLTKYAKSNQFLLQRYVMKK